VTTAERLLEGCQGTAACEPFDRDDLAAVRLDGKEQLRVFDEMEEQGWELWAIYHSHTHSEAYPSETDRHLAFYPESRYMVLSLVDRDQPELRSFFIEDGEITEEELTIA